MMKPSSSALGPSSSGDLFASVTALRGIELVQLPAAWAAAAVVEYLRLWTVEGRVDAQDTALWCVSVRGDRGRRQALLVGPCQERGDWFVYTYPRNQVVVPAGKSRWVRSALERVKPEQVDAAGCPLPWVPVRHSAQVVAPSQAGAGGEDDDIVSAADGEPLEPGPAPEESEARHGVPDQEIVQVCDRLRTIAGLPPLELLIGRAARDRHGFTSGRVWYGELFVPRRISLTVCPNADLAEVVATLLHEFAHPLSRTRVHGAAFKQTLVELAGAAHGAHYFEGARGAAGGPQDLLDLWISTGVRAALRGGEAPRPRVADDGAAARVVSRIRKLRALAADEPGSPEAIAATAAANDLATHYGFGNGEVRLDWDLDDQMVDRHLQVEKGKVWKRELAFAVGQFCSVFGLSNRGAARLHLFGRHADLVFAEHLYGICEEAIERKADAHLALWKAGLPVRPKAADTRRERSSFCATAVLGLRKKMKEITAADHGDGPDDHSDAARAQRRLDGALGRAEEFARGEHEKRGFTWGAGEKGKVVFNAAGFEAGKSIPLSRAFDEGGGARLALPRGQTRE